MRPLSSAKTRRWTSRRASSSACRGRVVAPDADQREQALRPSRQTRSPSTLTRAERHALHDGAHRRSDQLS